MSKKIRCFAAIEIPNDIKQEIDLYVQNLKEIAPEIKWVKARSLHITIKFLGEIEPDLCDSVKTSLDGISDVASSFKIKISDSGAFPNYNRPRVVWLGLSPSPGDALFNIFKWIDNNLSDLGFEKEKRKFSPHLTIGRIKYPGNFSSLFDYMNNNKIGEYEFNVSQVVLMQSQLHPTGAKYTPLKIYPF